MDLEEQIEEGKRLIIQGKSRGKDTKALEERVRVLEAQLKERNEKTPAWYTEEDRKAKAVLEGICKGCAHLLLVRDISSKHEFKGVWCAILKKKLEEAQAESCPKFRSLAQELAELIVDMKARGEIAERAGE